MGETANDAPDRGGHPALVRQAQRLKLLGDLIYKGRILAGGALLETLDVDTMPNVKLGIGAGRLGDVVHILAAIMIFSCHAAFRGWFKP